MVSDYRIELASGKYAFVLQEETDLLIEAYRYGEPWPAGLEWRFSQAIVAMLNRIKELEQQINTSKD